MQGLASAGRSPIDKAHRYAIWAMLLPLAMIALFPPLFVLGQPLADGAQGIGESLLSLGLYAVLLAPAIAGLYLAFRSFKLGDRLGKRVLIGYGVVAVMVVGAIINGVWFS